METKTAQTVSKLKSASKSEMVKAVQALSTVEYYERMAMSALYSRLAKIV